MGILAGLSFIAAARYFRIKDQISLDKSAEEIYIASQYHMTQALGQNGLQDILDKAISGNDSDVLGAKAVSRPSGMTDADWEKAKDNLYYISVVNGSIANQSVDDKDLRSVLKYMLPQNSIDEGIRSGGSYVICYNARNSSVYEVFYSEKAEEINYADNAQDYRHENGNHIPKALTGDQFGYYGGAASNVYGFDLNAVTVNVTNGNRLTARVTVPNTVMKDQSGNQEVDLTVSGKTSGAVRTIKLGTVAYKSSDQSITASGSVVPSDDEKYPGDGFQIAYIDLADKEFAGYFGVVLDDVTSPGSHFADLFAKSDNQYQFIPGEDIELSASVQPVFGTADDADNARTASLIQSSHVVTNSLFAEVSEEDKISADGEASESGSTQSAFPATARIASFRHLENLDPEISGLSPSPASAPAELTGGADYTPVTQAVQIDNLVWADASSGGGTAALYSSLSGAGCFVLSDPSKSYSTSDWQNILYNEGNAELGRTKGVIYGREAGSNSSLSASAGYIGVENASLTAFDGYNNTIYSVRMSGADTAGTGFSDASDSGLFRCVPENASLLVKDVRLISVITQSDGSAGAVVGTSSGTLSLSSVSVRDSYTDKDQEKTALEDPSKAQGYLSAGSAVIGGSDAGGLIGAVSGGKLTVEDSYATPYVIATKGSAGGLIGSVSSSSGSSITGSFAGGHTIGDGKTYGTGTIGLQEDRSLSYTYSEETADGTGTSKKTTTNPADIQKCYNVQSAGGNAGGLIGTVDKVSGNALKVTACYSTASAVCAGSGTDSTAGKCGTFIGSGASVTKDSILQCYGAGSAADGKFIADNDQVTGISPTAQRSSGTTKNASPYDAKLSLVYPLCTCAELTDLYNSDHSGTTLETGGRLDAHYGDWPDLESGYGDFGLVYYERLADEASDPEKANNVYYNGYLIKDPKNKSGVLTYKDMTYEKVHTTLDQAADPDQDGLVDQKGKYVSEDGYLLIVKTADAEKLKDTYLSIDGVTEFNSSVENGKSFSYYDKHVMLFSDVATEYKDVTLPGMDTTGYSVYSIDLSQIVSNYQYQASQNGIVLVLFQGKESLAVNKASFSFLPFFSDTVQAPDTATGKLPEVGREVSVTDSAGNAVTKRIYGIRSARQLNTLAANDGSWFTDSYLTNAGGGKSIVEQRMDITFDASKVTFTACGTDGTKTSDADVLGSLYLKKGTDGNYVNQSFPDIAEGGILQSSKSKASGDNSELYALDKLTNPLVGKESNSVIQGTIRGTVQNLRVTNSNIPCLLCTNDGLIENVNIESSVMSKVGLLSDNTKTIKDCFITDCEIKGNGFVDNNNYPNALIDSCTMTNVTVAGNGFLETNKQGTVKNCNIINAVIGENGFAGSNTDNSTISDCHIFSDRVKYGSSEGRKLFAASSSTADPDLKDISGYDTSGYNLVVIGAGKSDGKVSADYTGSRGGFIGQAGGTIEGCSVTGNVYGKEIGGFALQTIQASAVSIAASYANTYLSAASSAAGFIGTVSNGWQGCTIENCHSLGKITGNGSPADAYGFAGNMQSGSYSLKNNYAAVWSVSNVKNNSYTAFAGGSLPGNNDSNRSIRDCAYLNCIYNMDSVADGGADKKSYEELQKGGISNAVTKKYSQYNTEKDDTIYPFAVGKADQVNYGDWPAKIGKITITKTFDFSHSGDLTSDSDSVKALSGSLRFVLVNKATNKRITVYYDAENEAAKDADGNYTTQFTVDPGTYELTESNADIDGYHLTKSYQYSVDGAAAADGQTVEVRKNSAVHFTVKNTYSELATVYFQYKDPSEENGDTYTVIKYAGLGVGDKVVPPTDPKVGSYDGYVFSGKWYETDALGNPAEEGEANTDFSTYTIPERPEGSTGQYNLYFTASYERIPGVTLDYISITNPGTASEVINYLKSNEYYQVISGRSFSPAIGIAEKLNDSYKAESVRQVIDNSGTVTYNSVTEQNGAAISSDGKTVTFSVNNVTGDLHYQIIVSSTEATTYKVKYIYEDSQKDGNGIIVYAEGEELEVADTKEYPGVQGLQTSVDKNILPAAPEGFADPEWTDVIIKASDTVVEVHYNRNRYRINYDLQGGSLGGNSYVPYDSAEYGAQWTLKGTPVKSGYIFKGWNITYLDSKGATKTAGTDRTALSSYAMPAGEVTVTAHFEPKPTADYTVEFWVQAADKDKLDTPSDSKTYYYNNRTKLNGTVGAAITSDLIAGGLNDTDLNSSSVKDTYILSSNSYLPGKITLNATNTEKKGNVGSAVITADGNTVVRIYYDRDIVTYTFNYSNPYNNDSGTIDLNSTGALTAIFKEVTQDNYHAVRGVDQWEQDQNGDWYFGHSTFQETTAADQNGQIYHAVEGTDKWQDNDTWFGHGTKYTQTYTWDAGKYSTVVSTYTGTGNPADYYSWWAYSFKKYYRKINATDVDYYQSNEYLVGYGHLSGRRNNKSDYYSTVSNTIEGAAPSDVWKYNNGQWKLTSQLYNSPADYYGWFRKTTVTYQNSSGTDQTLTDVWVPVSDSELSEYPDAVYAHGRGDEKTVVDYDRVFSWILLSYYWSPAEEIAYYDGIEDALNDVHETPVWEETTPGSGQYSFTISWFSEDTVVFENADISKDTYTTVDGKRVFGRSGTFKFEDAVYKPGNSPNNLYDDYQTNGLFGHYEATASNTVVFQGLYEAPFSVYGYQWDNRYSWRYNYSSRDSYTTMTFLDSFSNPKDDTTFYVVKKLGDATVVHYTQNLDGTWKVGINSKSDSDTSFTFTQKFYGFTPGYYNHDDSLTATLGATAEVDASSLNSVSNGSVTSGSRLNVFHVRNTWKITYGNTLYSSYTNDSEGHAEKDFVTAFYEQKVNTVLPDKAYVDSHIAEFRPDTATALVEGIDSDYEFGGWYKSLSFDQENEITDADVMPNSNFQVFARWTPPDRTVTIYDTSDPSADPVTWEQSASVTVKKKDTWKTNSDLNTALMKNVVPDNYEFAGWYYDKSFERPFYNEDLITENISLYPKYKQNKGTKSVRIHLVSPDRTDGNKQYFQVDASGTVAVGEDGKPSVSAEDSYYELTGNIGDEATIYAPVLNGYKPAESSKKITISADVNDIYIQYQHVTTWSYTVKCVLVTNSEDTASIESELQAAVVNTYYSQVVLSAPEFDGLRLIEGSSNYNKTGATQVITAPGTYSFYYEPDPSYEYEVTGDYYFESKNFGTAKYNGKEHAVKLAEVLPKNVATTVTYYDKDGNKLEGAPVEAGEYSADIKVVLPTADNGEVTIWASEEKGISLEISAASQASGASSLTQSDIQALAGAIANTAKVTEETN